jgi:hypothetical protein
VQRDNSVKNIVFRSPDHHPGAAALVEEIRGAGEERFRRFVSTAPPFSGYKKAKSKRGKGK